MATAPPIVYTYKSCDTCRKAVKWLQANGIAFEERPIRDTPPTVEDIHHVYAAVGDWAKLFNRSGRDYRAGDWKTRLPTLSDDEKAAALAANGNLIKRPFVVLPDGGGMVGFDEAAWAGALELGGADAG